MTWTALTYAFGSKLTSTKMTQNQDNFTAMANGDASAPRIKQGALSTTTGEITATNGNAANTALPGGEYGFYPQMKTNDVTNTRPFGSILNEAGGIPTSYTTWMYIGNTNGTAGTTAYAQQRYVQASPPYEPYREGDAIPLFIFACLEKGSGRVLFTWTAPDPPWANNGPTILNPAGRLERLRQAKRRVTLRDVSLGNATVAEFHAALETASEPTQAEIETLFKTPITQAEKNADMALIPHPFLNFDPATQQVVVISATDGALCRGLSKAHCAGESVGDMLHGGYLVLDNAPVDGLLTPSSVLAVSARWKLSP